MDMHPARGLLYFVNCTYKMPRAVRGASEEASLTLVLVLHTPRHLQAERKLDVADQRSSSISALCIKVRQKVSVCMHGCIFLLAPKLTRGNELVVRIRTDDHPDTP